MRRARGDTIRSSHARAGAADGTTLRATARRSRSWIEWSSLAAAAWSAMYACMGAWWTSGRGRFPFGVGPASGPAASLLYGASARIGAPVVAALGIAGVAVALLIARRPPRDVHPVLRAYAWAMTVTLLVLVPDARAVVTAAYAPVFVIGAPFGWPPVSFAPALAWPIVNQHLCITGGFLWGATALVASRRARGACLQCGRDAGGTTWTTPLAARRWGTWATAVAVVAPLPYAATRLAWAIGIPLGASAEVLGAARTGDSWFPAGALASVAIGGALLTLGLVQRWGEVFPRVLPIVGGRRVRPAIAILPASVVAVLVFAAGLGVLRAEIEAGFRDWSTMSLVGLVWPLWGLALGTATLAYHYRRRGRCPRCGRW
jgi:hypothetical protein